MACKLCIIDKNPRV